MRTVGVTGALPMPSYRSRDKAEQGGKAALGGGAATAETAKAQSIEQLNERFDGNLCVTHDEDLCELEMQIANPG